MGEARFTPQGIRPLRAVRIATAVPVALVLGAAKELVGTVPPDAHGRVVLRPRIESEEVLVRRLRHPKHAEADVIVQRYTPGFRRPGMSRSSRGPGSGDGSRSAGRPLHHPSTPRTRAYVAGTGELHGSAELLSSQERHVEGRTPAHCQLWMTPIGMFKYTTAPVPATDAEWMKRDQRQEARHDTFAKSSAMPPPATPGSSR